MKQIFTFLILFTSTVLFSQSPWTQKEKKGYVQLSFSAISSYKEVFGNPDYKLQRAVTDNTLQLYGEFGINNKTTLFASVPFKLQKTGNATGTTTPIIAADNQTALGNIQIGVKHNFYNKDWLFSAQLAVEAKTGSFNNEIGLRTGVNAWTFTPLFLAGKSFKNSYLQAFTGFDVRTNGYSTNFKIGGEYGTKVFTKLWLIGFVDVVKSFKNGTVVLPVTNLLTASYVNNQEYGAFGAKAIYEFTNKWGINAGFGGAFFGRNVAKAPALSIGIYSKF